jgi:hypothetical protein
MCLSAFMLNFTSPFGYPSIPDRVYPKESVGIPKGVTIKRMKEVKENLFYDWPEEYLTHFALA